MWSQLLMTMTWGGWVKTWSAEGLAGLGDDRGGGRAEEEEVGEDAGLLDEAHLVEGGATAGDGVDALDVAGELLAAKAVEVSFEGRDEVGLLPAEAMDEGWRIAARGRER